MQGEPSGKGWRLGDTESNLLHKVTQRVNLNARNHKKEEKKKDTLLKRNPKHTSSLQKSSLLKAKNLAS